VLDSYLDSFILTYFIPKAYQHIYTAIAVKNFFAKFFVIVHRVSLYYKPDILCILEHWCRQYSEMTMCQVQFLERNKDFLHSCR